MRKISHDVNDYFSDRSRDGFCDQNKFSHKLETDLTTEILVAKIETKFMTEKHRLQVSD